VAVKHLPWALVLALGGLAFWQNCYDVSLVKEGVRLDSVYVTDTLRLTRVRRITDSVLKTDTVFRDTTVKRIVADERAICDAKAETCEKRVANLKAQLKPGWLILYGEGNYQPPLYGGPLLKGPLDARAGVMFRVKHRTYLYAGLNQPLTGDTTRRRTVNIGVRKELRIF
jgi:hypothetical protein